MTHFCTEISRQIERLANFKQAFIDLRKEIGGIETQEEFQAVKQKTKQLRHDLVAYEEVLKRLRLNSKLYLHRISDGLMVYDRFSPHRMAEDYIITISRNDRGFVNGLSCSRVGQIREIGAEVLQNFLNLEQIEILDFTGLNHLGQEDWEILNWSQCNASTVNISANNLGEKGLQNALKNKKLQKLHISCFSKFKDAPNRHMDWKAIRGNHSFAL